MTTVEINPEEIDNTYCRVCLNQKKYLNALFSKEGNHTYAELLNACTTVLAIKGDGFPDKICNSCVKNLEKCYNFKTTAERSNHILRKKTKTISYSLKVEDYDITATKKISFDTITDIKSELEEVYNLKSEPKFEIEIDLSNKLDESIAEQSLDGQDIIIYNTVIRKIEPALEDSTKKDLTNGNYDFDNDTWEDDFCNNDSDDDYVPPKKEKKEKPPKHPKFKKPTLSEIKVFKENKKNAMNRPKLKQIRDQRSTYITCYPVTKDGEKGSPVLLRRPKDASYSGNAKAAAQRKTPQNRARGPMKPAYLSKDSEIDKGDGVKQYKPVRRVERPFNPQREKLVCPVCGILTYSLQNHMLTHAEKKPFQCDQCSRSFVQKNNWKLHMKKHSGVRDHVCEICGAAFYCKKSVLRHKLIHQGDRPFACDLCPKKFLSKCALGRHLKIHSGYKPFKCTICTMSFNAKHQLQNHVRMHTGERPYTCQVCNVAFSYKVNLNNHVYRVHAINLKFKSIHTVTAEVLEKETEIIQQTRNVGLATQQQQQQVNMQQQQQQAAMQQQVIMQTLPPPPPLTPFITPTDLRTQMTYGSV